MDYQRRYFKTLLDAAAFAHHWAGRTLALEELHHSPGFTGYSVSGKRVHIEPDYSGWVVYRSYD